MFVCLGLCDCLYACVCLFVWLCVLVGLFLSLDCLFVCVECACVHVCVIFRLLVCLRACLYSMRVVRLCD